MGSRLQRKAGIEDGEDDMFSEYLAINVWDVNAGPVRRWAAHSGETIDWLQDHGCRSASASSSAGTTGVPVATVPRAAAGPSSTGGLAVSYRRIEFAVGNRVDEFIRDGGRVTGVRAGGEELTADAVIVATGGFGANPDHLARHYPSAWVRADLFLHRSRRCPR